MQYQDSWMKKAKWLTQALIISGTLNIGLLSTFIYFALKEKQSPVNTEFFSETVKEKGHTLGMQDLLRKYYYFSFQELLLRLCNGEHVESGYKARDLALACLVACHHFNLEHALGGMALQKRKITFTQEDGQEISLVVFPGLVDYQYKAILQYIKTEKWPLTSEGLFREIKYTKPPYDSSLMEAFFLTPEFHFLSSLFSRTGVLLKKEHMLALLAQGNWETIARYATILRKDAAYTLEERRSVLLQLTKEGSKLAAKVLLETDMDYCLKDLEDEQILNILHLLKDKNPLSFAKEILKCPRSDAVLKAAAVVLYEQVAENVPENIDLNTAKKRFIELKIFPETVSVKPMKSSKKTGKNIYVVVNGDSLWKIARDKKVTVAALKKANNLKSDNLHLGQELIIPSN